MDSSGTVCSPNIVIYIEIGEKRIRLADVLGQSAALYEPAEVPPNTEASLVFIIGNDEEREEILLKDGIGLEDRYINFMYANGHAFKNGRITGWCGGGKTAGLF